MLVISEAEAIRKILESKNRFACYLGAGASVEAGVPTAAQICGNVRADLAAKLMVPKETEDQWAAGRLAWNNLALRYVTCIKTAYQNEAGRVEYFREMLRRKVPSFSHHAVAMLMAREFLKRTCITTNFDKLVERAFAIQGDEECQPIRSLEELRFWRAEASDRSFTLKLHGDYDTYNILNTDEEVIRISDKFRDKIVDYLKYSGLVVLGSAGWEKSIYTLFDYLGESAASGETLQHGLFWGVHVDTPQGTNLSDGQLEDLVMQRVDRGICPEITSMIKRVGRRSNELFCFFPVSGTGSFLFRLIETINRIPKLRDRNLFGIATTYLDHEMRLEHILQKALLPENVIRAHIERLRKRSDDALPKIAPR
jgi:SIR2-like domain